MTTPQDSDPIAQPDDGEVLVAVTTAIQQRLGPQRTVVDLHRRPAWNRSSFALEELDVMLDDGTQLSLMRKDVSWRGLSRAARCAKPRFVYHPLREIETYRAILQPANLGTAAYYGAIVAPDADRYWLFIERVQGQELFFVGLPVWEQVAAWLAGFHLRFQIDPLLSQMADASHLLHYDAEFYFSWLRRAQDFGQTSSVSREALVWLAARYDLVVDQLLSLPLTFIHGEFYASNVLVADGETALRVCPVDWEMAALGPGLVDLAALTAGSWKPEEQQTIAKAYYEASKPNSKDHLLSFDVFQRALICCRIHAAVQWLGWSADWTAPASHQQDWLAVALESAEKLGL